MDVKGSSWSINNDTKKLYFVPEKWFRLLKLSKKNGSIKKYTERFLREPKLVHHCEKKKKKKKNYIYVYIIFFFFFFFFKSGSSE